MRTRAQQMPHNRTEDPIRPAPDIAKRHVRDVQLARMLEALVFIILAIALRDRQSVVHVIENHAVVGDVAHEAASAAAGQGCGFLRVCVGPYFDARAFG